MILIKLYPKSVLMTVFDDILVIVSNSISNITMVIVISIVPLIQDFNQHSPIIFKAGSLNRQWCSENRVIYREKNRRPCKCSQKKLLCELSCCLHRLTAKFCPLGAKVSQISIEERARIRKHILVTSSTLSQRLEELQPTASLLILGQRIISIVSSASRLCCMLANKASCWMTRRRRSVNKRCICGLILTSHT